MTAYPITFMYILCLTLINLEYQKDVGELENAGSTVLKSQARLFSNLGTCEFLLTFSNMIAKRIQQPWGPDRNMPL